MVTSLNSFSHCINIRILLCDDATYQEVTSIERFAMHTSFALTARTPISSELQAGLEAEHQPRLIQTFGSAQVTHRTRWHHQLLRLGRRTETEILFTECCHANRQSVRSVRVIILAPRRRSAGALSDAHVNA